MADGERCKQKDGGGSSESDSSKQRTSLGPSDKAHQRDEGNASSNERNKDGAERNLGTRRVEEARNRNFVSASPPSLPPAPRMHAQRHSSQRQSRHLTAAQVGLLPQQENASFAAPFQQRVPAIHTAFAVSFATRHGRSSSRSGSALLGQVAPGVSGDAVSLLRRKSAPLASVLVAAEAQKTDTLAFDTAQRPVTFSGAPASEHRRCRTLSGVRVDTETDVPLRVLPARYALPPASPLLGALSQNPDSPGCTTPWATTSFFQSETSNSHDQDIFITSGPAAQFEDQSTGATLPRNDSVDELGDSISKETLVNKNVGPKAKAGEEQQTGILDDGYDEEDDDGSVFHRALGKEANEDIENDDTGRLIAEDGKELPEKRQVPLDAIVNATGRLIVVSNRLPVSIKRTREAGKKNANTPTFLVTPSSGGLVSALEGLKRSLSFLWIGWPGMEIESASERAEIEALLATEHSCCPVFLPKKTAKLHYDGFSNTILWPLFHYLTDEVYFNQAAWAAYVAANYAFAETIAPMLRPGDIVWVHDYHLMLLPQMLREILRAAGTHTSNDFGLDANGPKKVADKSSRSSIRCNEDSIKIGFFLHTPFPSSEMYSVLPVRRELLKGVLHSDMIGFHTIDYSHHFLSSCTRVLGLHTEDNCAMFQGRRVYVRAIPIGIDPISFKTALTKPSVQAHISSYRTRFDGLKIVLGVDRLDYIKGIPNKLHAFRRFLEKYPQYAGKAVLLQVGVPSRTAVASYQELEARVNELVGRINGKHGRIGYMPIHYLYQSVSFEQLTALYAVADACLVSSTRDGMNLVSYEYVACQSKGCGTLLLSEFAGAARSLLSAVQFNPWDIDEAADAIYSALSQSSEDCNASNRSLMRHVNKFTAMAWGDKFITDLMQIPARTNRLTSLSSKRRLSYGALVQAFGATSLKNSMVSSQEQNNHAKLFKKESNDDLECKIVFFRYDGVVQRTVGYPEFAEPSKRLRAVLQAVARIPGTLVYVVSSRSRSCLAKWFEGLPLGLIAEHGSFFKHPDFCDKRHLELDKRLKKVLGEVQENQREASISQNTPGSILNSGLKLSGPPPSLSATLVRITGEETYSDDTQEAEKVGQETTKKDDHNNNIRVHGERLKDTLRAGNDLSSNTRNGSEGATVKEANDDGASNGKTRECAGSQSCEAEDLVSSVQQQWWHMEAATLWSDDSSRVMRATLIRVFDYFMTSTPGSSLEMKETGITWHYKDADAEFGRWQARELRLMLERSIGRFPISLGWSDTFVEVSHARASALGVVAKIVEHLLHSNKKGIPSVQVSSILYIGSSASPEDPCCAWGPMAKWFESQKSGSGKTATLLEKCNVAGVAVGQNLRHGAAFYVESLAEAVGLLGRLAREYGDSSAAAMI